jgi:hypothetical protein
MSNLALIPSLAFGAALWSGLLGVLVAWIKLRRTDVWVRRPDNVRSLDLLLTFTRPITGASTIFGAFVGLAIFLGGLVS